MSQKILFWFQDIFLLSVDPCYLVSYVGWRKGIKERENKMGQWLLSKRPGKALKISVTLWGVMDTYGAQPT